ncbi:MAG: Putative insecticidal toxin complex [uncultured Caballeronia sp.]|nr:MAG: Putative insecticidal toxin complex [uncultured Caballeronia sp.]
MDDSVKPNFKYVTSLNGKVLSTESVDAGNNITLNDVEGRPHFTLATAATPEAVVHTWQYEDNKLSGRVLSITEVMTDGATRITERFVYAGISQQEKNLNLAGECVSHYDTAGLVRTNSVSLGSVPLSVTRQLLKEKESVADWQGEDARIWNRLLDTEAYTSLTTADATGAVLITTDATDNQQRVAYDVAGLLSGSWLDGKGRHGASNCEVADILRCGAETARGARQWRGDHLHVRGGDAAPDRN